MTVILVAALAAVSAVLLWREWRHWRWQRRMRDECDLLNRGWLRDWRHEHELRARAEERVRALLADAAAVKTRDAAGPVAHRRCRMTADPVATPYLVSVLAPAYRCAPFIGEMIASLQAQTYDRWELIVVDDGSDDEQAEIVAAAQRDDARVRLERIAHAGYATAFNAALALARGVIIARQDADDWSAPDRLERQVGALRGANICTCGIAQVHADRRRSGAFVTGMEPERFLTDPVPRGPGGAVCVAKRYVYDRIGGFHADYEWSADSEWYLRALLEIPRLRWVHVAADLYYYRRHARQMQRLDGGRALAVHRERRDYYRPLILARHRH